MIPAAITVLLLALALVGGGVWIATTYQRLRDDVDELADEVGRLKARPHPKA